MKIGVKFFEVLVILILSLTPLFWFRGGEVIIGHDSGFRLNPVSHLQNLFYSWDPSFNFGTDWSLFKGFLVAQAPEALFITLTGSLSAGQMLTSIFWFFIMGISMYIFINAFFPDKKYWVLRLFGSTFYMYNFFLLQAWFIFERSKFSLFAAFPLGLLVLYKTLTREYSLLKGTVLFSITFFLLNGGGNPTLFGFILLSYCVVAIYLLFQSKVTLIRSIIFTVKVLLFFAIGFLLLNAYWVLPQVYLIFSEYEAALASSGGISGILNWEQTINRNASFINMFRLQGIPDWYDNKYHQYAGEFLKNPLLILFSFLPFLTILLGVFLRKSLGVAKNSHYRLEALILLLFLVGIIFTSGSHPPLGFLYTFFIEYIPGFAIFRSAFYKFGTLYWFSYIFLCAFYVQLLLLRFIKKRFLYGMLGFLGIVFIIAYHYPFFLSNFFEWKSPFTTKVKLPSYVYETAEYFKNTPDSSRFLLLPPLDPAFNADLYEWGFWSLDTLPRLATNRSIVTNSVSYPGIMDAIYDAIEQNDEKSFLHMVKIYGITNILWRDDIVYAENPTSGENLRYLKENIESFSNISIEKEFGRWTVYKVQTTNALSQFFAANSGIHSYTETTSLQNIIAGMDYPEIPVFFQEQIKGKSKDLSTVLFGDVVQAICVLCQAEDANRLAGGIAMPKILLLPNSSFYFLAELKEQRTFALHKDNPKLRIDADLGYANRRIAEMKEIASQRRMQDARSLIQEGILRYKQLVNDALSQTNALVQDEKNESMVKILTYLHSQYQFLGVDANLYDYVLEDFEELSIFMQETIRKLENTIWTSSLQGDTINYFFNIVSDGMYEVKLVSNSKKEVQPLKIIIDEEKEATSSGSIYLKEGVHRLVLFYPESENMVSYQETAQSRELRLPFGKRSPFRIKDYDSLRNYHIAFDYKITHGRPNAAIVRYVRGSRIVQSLQLQQNSIWNSLQFMFKSNANSKNATIEFFPTGFDTSGAAIQIKNFTVMVKPRPPEVIFSKKLPTIDGQVPNVSFERINPTKYIASIKNASTPFLLIFQQAYNVGWNASIREGFGKDKQITEENHYPVNGYMNGWLVKKSGNYTIIVEYFPQKIFYAGLGISSGSILLMSLVLLVKKRKDA